MGVWEPAKHSQKEPYDSAQPAASRQAEAVRGIIRDAHTVVDTYFNGTSAAAHLVPVGTQRVGQPQEMVCWGRVASAPSARDAMRVKDPGGLPLHLPPQRQEQEQRRVL